MTFLNPFWLPFCAVPVLLALYAIYARKKKKENRNAFVSSPRLIAKLISQNSPFPWWIATLLITASAILIFISLAQPTSGKSTIELPSKGRKIYLAVDCSRSMLVKDVTPDRLTVAKTAALEIIEAFPQEKIGLLSFAGSAWLEAPLTTDHTALRDAVLEMNLNTIPYGGSSPAPLLELVTENQMEEEQPTEALLIILSDGEFHNAPSAEQVRKTKETGVRIFTLGFGTAEGDFIPHKNSRDGLYRNSRGRTIRSSLKEDPLEKVARLGNGAYFKGDDYSFINRLGTSLTLMEGEETSPRNLVIHNHIYYYFLIPALFFILLASLTPHLWKIMKNLIPVFICSLILLPESKAATNSNPANSPTKEQLSEKDYFNVPVPKDEKVLKSLEADAISYAEKAREAKGENIQRYKFTQGVAEYKGENYSEAIQSFSDSLLSENAELQTEAHYNLGNSLFKYGQQLSQAIPKLKKPEDQINLRGAIISQWEDSLDHYAGSLHLDSDHKTARENYEYVKQQLKKLQEEQKKQSKECNGEGEEGKGQGKGKPKKKGEGEGEDEADSDEDGLTEDELEEKMKEAEENGYDPMGGKTGEEKEEENAPPMPEESDRQEELERRPGETERDYAERKLKEGSDSETGNLKSRRRIFSSPEKDW